MIKYHKIPFKIKHSCSNNAHTILKKHLVKSQDLDITKNYIDNKINCVFMQLYAYSFYIYALKFFFQAFLSKFRVFELSINIMVYIFKCKLGPAFIIIIV